MLPNAGSHFSMGWNGNTMNPYMANMFNMQNSMGGLPIVFLVLLSFITAANIDLQECPWGWDQWQIRGCSVTTE